MNEQKIVTPCPSCDGKTLFIGEGGHLTCSYIECKEPVVEAQINQFKRQIGTLREIVLGCSKCGQVLNVLFHRITTKEAAVLASENDQS